MAAGKFTQIRPWDSTRIGEKFGFHFPIRVDLLQANFCKSAGKVPFAQLRKLALQHIQSEEFSLRLYKLNDVLAEQGNDLGHSAFGGAMPNAQFLLAVRDLMELTEGKALAGEDAPLTRIDNALSLAPTNYPQGITHRLNEDLLALYLNPGLIPEYRIFLGALHKVCSVIADGTLTAGKILSQQANNVRNLSPVHLRFLRGKILLPTLFDAASNREYKQTESDPQSVAFIDRTIAGHSISQFPDHLTSKPFDPVKLKLPPKKFVEMEPPIEVGSVPRGPIVPHLEKSTPKPDSNQKN